MRKTTAAVCLAAWMAGGVATAEVIEHQASGLEFTLPDAWGTEQDGDLLTASSPDQGVVVFFFVSEHSTAQAFLDSMSAELDRLISHAEITREATEEQINGLTQVYVEGTGEHDGETVDWDLTLVVGDRASLVVVAMGDLEGRADAINAIYNSIQR